MKVFGSLLLAVSLAFQGCTTFRAIRCGTPSSDTFMNFALDTIVSGNSDKSVLVSSDNHDRFFEDSKFTGNGLDNETIGDYFSRVRGDGALLILRNDTVLLERYFGRFKPLSPSNIFSVTKAVTALLCGIAADEHYLEITDPVTKYIPELNNADPLFKKLTIEHLLDMRSGLDFDDNYGWNPFSRMARLYYGSDVVSKFKKLRFRAVPGTEHHYNSMATAILGVIIERAVGIPFARYLQEKVWKPLDMESDAFISLDDSKHRQAKAYGGLATNVRDLAKIGRLYIHGGNYNGRQIVSKKWIDRSTHASLDNNAYSFGWNNIITGKDGKNIVTPRFFAIGLFGQILFCDPVQNLIFVTLGENKGCEYHLLFNEFCNSMQN